MKTESTQELTLEATITFMIDEYKSSSEALRNTFLSFWIRLCCLDKTTGLFNATSAFTTMHQHHQKRQQIIRLKKELSHLNTAKDLLEHDPSLQESEQEWITGIRKALSDKVNCKGQSKTPLNTKVSIRLICHHFCVCEVEFTNQYMYINQFSIYTCIKILRIESFDWGKFWSQNFSASLSFLGLAFLFHRSIS